MNPLTPENPTASTRPLGFWLKTVDRLLAAEFASAFGSEGATRRDWRLLNIVDGTAASDRPLRGPRIRALAERGWITRVDATWTLTDEGRTAKERLSDAVQALRDRVREAVPAADFETTLATLETLARSLGWDESNPRPEKSRDKRHGVHHRGRFGRPTHGHRPHCSNHEERHENHGHGHGHEHHHGHRTHQDGTHHGVRRSERAYARGFEAGFFRGRDA